MQMNRKWKVDGWLVIWTFGSFRLLTYIYVCVCSRSIFKLRHINNTSCDVLVYVTQIWEITGWWFGTFLIVPYIGKFHHPNWLSYFSEGLKPPTSWHEKRMQDVVPIYWGKEHNILDTIRMIRDVTGKTNQGWLGIIPKWPNFSNIIYPDVLYNHALQIVTWKCWLFEWNFGHHSCFFPVLFIYSNISVQWLMADHNGGITGTANGHDTIMLHSPLHSGNLT